MPTACSCGKWYDASFPIRGGPHAAGLWVQVADVVDRDALIITRDIEWYARNLCYCSCWHDLFTACCRCLSPVAASYAIQIVRNGWLSAGVLSCSASSRPTNTPCSTRTATRCPKPFSILPISPDTHVEQPKLAVCGVVDPCYLCAASVQLFPSSALNWLDICGCDNLGVTNLAECRWRCSPRSTAA